MNSHHSRAWPVANRQVSSFITKNGENCLPSLCLQEHIGPLRSAYIASSQLNRCLRLEWQQLNKQVNYCCSTHWLTHCKAPGGWCAVASHQSPLHHGRVVAAGLPCLLPAVAG